MRHDPVALGDAGSLGAGAFAAAVERAVEAARDARSPAEALEGALSALQELPCKTFAAAFVLEHGRLWLVATRGYAMIPDGLDPEEGVLGRAVRSGVPQLVEDVATDPDFLEVAAGVRSELAIPLCHGGDVVGLVNVETVAAMPPEAAELAVPLAEALAPAAATMRAAPGLGLSGLARLLVFMGTLRDVDAIAAVTARSLARVLPLESTQVVLLDDARRPAEVASWNAGGDGCEPLDPLEVEAVRGHVGPSAVFEQLDTTLVGLPELAGSGVRTVVLLPLRASGAELGLLAGTSRFPRAFDHHQAEAATLLAAHAAASIDAAVSLSRERVSASTDSLTGLLNRRGFEERLDLDLQRAQDERRPFTLLVLDCDDFKEVNDRAGHEFGDALLREVGAVLARSLGEGGYAGRLGGDEFAVLFPDVDAEEAESAAGCVLARLRDGLREAGFPLRVSGGTATYPYDGGAVSLLLRAADQALYAAKGAGKNRVHTFRDVARGEPIADARRAADLRAKATATHGGLIEAVSSLWAETTATGVLERLCKSLTFVVGASGCVVSRVEGRRLVDLVRHTLREVDLGDESAYVIDDFPLTYDVLDRRESRAVSFLDEDLDRAEAFVLRELGMNCCLMVPLVVGGRSWGLVELYDVRLRRYGPDETATAEFLVTQAGRCLERVGDASPPRRRLPLFRPPSA